ncbi:hypothetical protein GQ44DRAFT_772872 [Phaeosphaeriaceae sp. PMI808]|nr:hypothetical protein GQ44DRAFT_772872 [Phaeosphaeriaceae sp. PMI808]
MKALAWMGKDSVKMVEMPKPEALWYAHNSLAIHIKCQNPALLVRRHGTAITFEAFELLAKTKDVANTPGRLIRWFPGSSVTIPTDTLEDSSFRIPLLDALAGMDAEMAPAIERDEEKWDTHPRLVTHMVMGILRGAGTGATEPKPSSRICKHSREEVIGGGKYPWQRSPLWLMVRIILRLILEDLDPHSPSPRVYKEFMAFFMSRVLGQAVVIQTTHDVLFMMMAKISRRLVKLSPLEAGWLSRAAETLKATHERLEKA